MALPPDPALEPVPAARAAMAAAAAAAAPKAGTEAPRPFIGAAEPDRWSRTIALGFGLVVDGVPLRQLTLRRLTARELTEIIMRDDGEESINRRARAAIAGVHPDVLDALDADDAVEVAEAIRPFLPRALQGAESIEMDVLAAAAGSADAPA